MDRQCDLVRFRYYELTMLKCIFGIPTRQNKSLRY